MKLIGKAAVAGRNAGEEISLYVEDGKVIVGVRSAGSDSYEGCGDASFDLAGLDALLVELGEARKLIVTT